MGMFVVATTLLLLVLCGGCEGFLTTNDPNRQITRSILTNVFSPRRIERATFHFQTSSSSSSRSRCHANSHSREFQRLGSSISSTSGTDISASTSLVDLCWAEFSEGGETHTYRAPPVLLLHGLLGSKRNFASLGTSLAAQLQQKRRIYAVDLRNHGENGEEGWRDDMSYEEMARDVLAVMDKHGLEQAVLVGHSMGGKVAKACALLEPDRVSGLVVLDIAPVRYCPTQDKSWKSVQDIIQAMTRISLLQEVNNNESSTDHDNDTNHNNVPPPPTISKTKRMVDLELRSIVEDPAVRAFVLTNLETVTVPMTHHEDPKNDSITVTNKPVLRWKIPVKVIAQQLETLAGFDLPSISLKNKNSQSYPGDAFFIHGGQSRFVRHSHMDAIAHFFPNHMLTTIRGVGHWVHAEAPDDTLALLKRYLDR